MSSVIPIVEGDIHRKTAADLFEVPENQVTPEMRKVGKTVNLGVIYGKKVFHIETEPFKLHLKWVNKLYKLTGKIHGYFDYPITTA